MGAAEAWGAARDEDEQRQGFRLAFEAAPLTLEQVWIRYFGIGGQAGLTEVQAYLYGALNFPALDRDLLAHALNETLNALSVNGPRASYSQNMHTKSEDGEWGTH
ncbi:hypothetical protein [Arthrobacter sp. ZGTC412]|uniref:hypothetical protein n=1 Tax=Arthrobacter sp. ZGTC412 TaxID=2058900 RepID=UPI000CE3C985|nr:hypothetical protein [Arthrobacter sp. ZGTC412]